VKISSGNNVLQMGDGESCGKGGRGSGRGDCRVASSARASPKAGLLDEEEG